MIALLLKYMQIAMMFPVLIAALLSFSCTKDSTSIEDSVNTDKTIAAPASLNKALMLQIVNDVRKEGCRCGDTYYNPVAALTWNDQLEAAAYKHSEDMYKKDYFSHIAADGSNGGVRIQKEGYNWLTYGENIAMGPKTEREVVNGWLKSPGHCKNIMNRNFKEMGVAKAGTYWTQEFAAK